MTFVSKTMKQLFIILTGFIMTTTLSAQSWIDTALYPFENHFLTLPDGDMHYIDEGEGPVILFVHGTPTWSFLYRDFVKELSKTNRCIAIDHLGFGLSHANNNFDGTPQSHSANLSALIEHLDLKEVTLVVHDFGGPIGLGAALQSPDRIKNIVLFNTWMWETKNDPEALKIDKIINSWMGKQLYLNFNFSPKVLLKKGFNDKKNLSKHIHQHYIKPFPTRTSRIPLLQIGQSLVGSSDWYQEQWEMLDKLKDKQWLILWGAQDEFITTKYLDKWQQRLPNAKVVQYQCGHFVQEEETEQAIGEISTLMNGDYYR